jgi:WhiB family redox-sensing transcriptional regulator
VPTVPWPVGFLHLPPLPPLPRAACRGQDPSLFLPEKYKPADAARAICETCPELDACRAYALAAPDNLQGIWGGLSQRQRRKIRSEARVNDAIEVTSLRAESANGHNGASSGHVPARAPEPETPAPLAANGNGPEPACVVCGNPVPAERVARRAKTCCADCAQTRQRTEHAGRNKARQRAKAAATTKRALHAGVPSPVPPNPVPLAGAQPLQADSLVRALVSGIQGTLTRDTTLSIPGFAPIHVRESHPVHLAELANPKEPQ